jgi:hypothetical protein
LGAGTGDRAAPPAVRPGLLAERITREDELGVKNLTAADIAAFLLGECACLKLSSAECYANGLRSLLRFLHLRG